MSLRQGFGSFARAGRWFFRSSQHESRSRTLASSATASPAVVKRSALFSSEKKRQRQSVGRIEKIEVDLMSDFGNELLIMNKELSTPHDCAKHISKHISSQALLALVDSVQPWDMHKPLNKSCQLQFLKSTDRNPYLANNTFWRSCSFMLGSVVSEAFRDDISVILHSFPTPNLFTGSFVLDAYVGLDSWDPSPEELRALSSGMIKLAGQELPFEYLAVSEEVAKEMFSDNPYKVSHIEKISAIHNDVVVYRVGNHVDISRGPMMNHTGLLGRCTIASVHYLKDDQLFRFQGVALPKGHRLNHYAYGILEKRARHLNEHMIPSQISFEPTQEFSTEAREVQQ